jgi:hypothetical protein
MLPLPHEGHVVILSIVIFEDAHQFIALVKRPTIPAIFSPVQGPVKAVRTPLPTGLRRMVSISIRCRSLPS